MSLGQPVSDATLLAEHAPWMLRPLLWLFDNPGRNPERYLEELGAGASPRDRELIGQPQVKEMLLTSLREAASQGMRGSAWEHGLLRCPWGFRLHEIQKPVFIWHGEADRTLPSSIGRALADAIPRNRATFRPDEGHLLLLSEWEQILRPLLSESLPCPRCDGTLGQQSEDRYGCPTCSGVFAVSSAIRSLLIRVRAGHAPPPGTAAGVGPYRSMQAQTTLYEEAQVRYLPCPFCSQPMNRSRLIKGRDIVVDICLTHGAWFDSGELEKAAEYVQGDRATDVDKIGLVLDYFFRTRS